MHIDKVTLCNFRCFGPSPTSVNLDRLTCLIGDNGSGKSAVLHALVKLFGVLQSERRLYASDFHVPKGEKLGDKDERHLFIEVRIAFPELAKNNKDHGVPECFNQMVIENPGELPYCRIRLEATWENSNTAYGEIDETRFWITSSEENFNEGSKKKMRGVDRSVIHVHYVPANRNPSQQIGTAADSILNRLLHAMEWSENFRDYVDDVIQQISDKFELENGIEVLKTSLAETWSDLAYGDFFQTVSISPLGSRFEDIVSSAEAKFQPSPDETDETWERLSDGMRSLFYLTLIKTAFDVDEQILTHESTGISRKRLSVPYLSILAIEEPENHLGPHYLGRVFNTCRRMLCSHRAQLALTSHSPSVLRRIDPEEIRFLRLSDKRESIIKRISLPSRQDEAFKYVKQAVQAHPELYFSKVVVLGEGDSEEALLPAIARATGFDMDIAFVSVVPLGGRHVNHFWRLLEELKIPYFTLLDYDHLREGGGCDRIKYICDQLSKHGRTPEHGLMKEKYDDMCRDPDDLDSQKHLLLSLEKQNIFFSFELDIDYLMLKAFPDAYFQLAPVKGGPRIPEPGDKQYDEQVKSAFAAIVKKDPNSIKETPTWINPVTAFWYRYLFLGRAKPSTHSMALLNIQHDQLKMKSPDVLKRLILKVESSLSSTPAPKIEEL